MRKAPKEGRSFADTFEVTEKEHAFFWRKIAAAGEMKSAIKWFLADCEECIMGTCEPHKRMRKAVEEYLNVDVV